MLHNLLIAAQGAGAMEMGLILSLFVGVAMTLVIPAVRGRPR